MRRSRARRNQNIHSFCDDLNRQFFKRNTGCPADSASVIVWQQMPDLAGRIE
jgi:hypothetical protein